MWAHPLWSFLQGARILYETVAVELLLQLRQLRLVRTLATAQINFSYLERGPEPPNTPDQQLLFSVGLSRGGVEPVHVNA